MKNFQKPDGRNAYEAKFEAQKIAFSPFVFQAVRALLKTGILRRVSDAGRTGVGVARIAEDLRLNRASVGVLLDMALSANLIWQKPEGGALVLDKIGYFLLNDEMTRVNFNFTADVNYLALDKLTEAITTGKPAGLDVFTSEHETIYPFISKLPEPARTSWLEFDHFYSDGSFDLALDKILAGQPRVLVDIGCNTGRFAVECLGRDPDLRMILVDLPEQIETCRATLTAAGLADRVRLHPCDLLKETLPVFADADAVWMSQFLDCFSLEEIDRILALVGLSTPRGCDLFVMELFHDRQPPEAAYCLNAISLYFTAVANGKSRMYAGTDLLDALTRKKFKVLEQCDNIGVGGHSLLKCRQA